MLYELGIFFFFLISIYLWLGIKKAYERGETLPLHVSVAIWIGDMLHFVLVLWASLRGLWLMPIDKIVALALGIAIGVVGLFIMLLGMFEFRSLKRMSGMDASRLITTGIYRYSRNPQYLGWFLALLGISIAGRSFLAFLLTLLLVIGIHLYNVKLEEPYLERIFGEEYRKYKESTPRYFGMRKKGSV